MSKSKLQRKVDKPDRIAIHWLGLKSDIKKAAGIDMTLKDPDLKALEEQMNQNKKPAEFYYSVDGTKFIVDVRVGSKKTILGQFDLASEKDTAKRRATLQYLVANDLAAQSDLDQFRKTNPDPQEVEKLKADVRRLELDLGSDKGDRDILKKWNDYDAPARAAGYNAQALLKEWLKEKKPSWVHYIDFVDAIEEGADAKGIFEKYMRAGAELPVNLPPKYQGPVEHAIANGQVPDLKPARSAIVKMVNLKFIPLFRKDRVALYEKSIKDWESQLTPKKKQLAGMGVR